MVVIKFKTVSKLWIDYSTCMVLDKKDYLKYTRANTCICIHIMHVAHLFSMCLIDSSMCYRPFPLWFQCHSIPLVSDPKIYGCKPEEAVLGPWRCLHWCCMSRLVSWSRTLWLSIVYLWHRIQWSQLSPAHTYKGMNKIMFSASSHTFVNLVIRICQCWCIMTVTGTRGHHWLHNSS